jgi:hypothetical protein
MDSNLVGKDTLESLLQSCASITKNSLSCRTFSKAQQATSIEALLRREEAITEWLESQILEQRVHLELDKAKSSVHSPLGTRRELQQQLIDSSARMQLEHLLLSRILASRSALQVLSEDVVARHTQTVRDNLALGILSSSRDLQGLRRQSRDEEEACIKLRHDIKKQWERRSSKQQELSLSESDRRIIQENIVLRHLIADLFVANGVNWYDDGRFRYVFREDDGHF